MCKISSADCFISGFTASQSPQLRLRSIVGYTLLDSLSFAQRLLPKFSPATAGDIDCNLSLFHLQKDDKKAADIFSYHRLKTQVLSFNFRYIKHLRFVSVDKKIRAISVALNRLVLRTDFNPDY